MPNTVLTVFINYLTDNSQHPSKIGPISLSMRQTSSPMKYKKYVDIKVSFQLTKFPNTRF